METPDTSLDCLDAIPKDEWPVYMEGMQAVQRAGVPFALGGGVAYGCYAHRCRYTKDIDLFIRPEDREAAIEAIRSVGFVDYFDEKPYERHWIFRGHRDGLILDLIWQMANRRADVDDDWVKRGPTITVHDLDVRVLPMEEMIWGKLYVMQRERCDWTDIFNVIEHSAAEIDWNHLIARVGDDAPLLAAVLQVYGWMVPHRAHEIPAHAWNTLGVPLAAQAPGDVDRIALLDSRQWFGASDTPCPPQKEG